MFDAFRTDTVLNACRNRKQPSTTSATTLMMNVVSFGDSPASPNSSKEPDGNLEGKSVRRNLTVSRRRNCPGLHIEQSHVGIVLRILRTSQEANESLIQSLSAASVIRVTLKVKYFPSGFSIVKIALPAEMNALAVELSIELLQKGYCSPFILKMNGKRLVSPLR